MDMRVHRVFVTHPATAKTLRVPGKQLDDC
jgi:hypothetical protein